MVTSFNQNSEWNKEVSSNLNSGDQIIHTITTENGQCFSEVPTGMCSADTASHDMYSVPPVSDCLLTSKYLRWSCYHLSKPNQTFHCDKHVSYCTTAHIYLEVSISFEHYVSNTGLFISPSGISELDCATTKIDMAERSISIGRESLQVFFCTRGLGLLPGSTARG